MLRNLLATARGSLIFVLFFLNTGFWCTLLLLLGLVRLVTPVRAWRRVLAGEMVECGARWAGVNGTIISVLIPTRWVIEGVENLDYDTSNLIISNHQSWSDIFAVLKVFHGRIPFPKFFVKQELLWVPLLGAAMWAVDMPFMKRYSKKALRENPELRGIDVETTRKACKHYRENATTVINYTEGTRFRKDKHERQQSPYRYLLKPKAGGIALVLEIMGDTMESVLDVTTIYRGPSTHFWDFICGRLEEITVDVREVEVPAELMAGGYHSDAQFRRRFQAWVREIWEEKDRRIAQMLETGAQSR